MKKYFQNLFQMLTTTYLVWYRPHDLNINKSVVIFDISDMFNKEIEHKEFDLIELENELSRIFTDLKILLMTINNGTG